MNKKYEHTPGPWEVWDNTDKTPNTYRIVRNARFTEQRNGLAICGTKGDANLIAAAPELYTACSAVIQAITMPNEKVKLTDLLSMLQSAISKADGQE